jgi:hypothetical protein
LENPTKEEARCKKTGSYEERSRYLLLLLLLLLLLHAEG